MSIDDARLKKLKFRAWRRGFREADLILGPFADQYVAGFDSDLLDEFERLHGVHAPGMITGKPITRAMNTVPRDQSMRPSERSKMRSVDVKNDGIGGRSRAAPEAASSRMASCVMAPRYCLTR